MVKFCLILLSFRLFWVDVKWWLCWRGLELIVGVLEFIDVNRGRLWCCKLCAPLLMLGKWTAEGCSEGPPPIIEGERGWVGCVNGCDDLDSNEGLVMSLVSSTLMPLIPTRFGGWWNYTVLLLQSSIREVRYNDQGLNSHKSSISTHNTKREWMVIWQGSQEIKLLVMLTIWWQETQFT